MERYNYTDVERRRLSTPIIDFMPIWDCNGIILPHITLLASFSSQSVNS
jgi:hypothetical protein